MLVILQVSDLQAGRSKAAWRSEAALWLSSQDDIKTSITFSRAAWEGRELILNSCDFSKLWDIQRLIQRQEAGGNS